MIPRNKTFLSICFSFLLIDAAEQSPVIEKPSPDISKLTRLLVASVKNLVLKAEQKQVTVPLIVGIAGCSAVGKTTFTAAFKKVLDAEDIVTTILPQDDYINPLHDHPILTHPSFDYQRLERLLLKIKSGWHVRLREKYNWSKKKFEKVRFYPFEPQVILFEGTYALTDSSSYNYKRFVDLGIFFAADPEKIVAWNWDRETSKPHGGRSRERFDKDVAWDMDDYKNCIFPTRFAAHFIITKREKNAYLLTGSVV